MYVIFGNYLNLIILISAGNKVTDGAAKKSIAATPR